MLDFERSMSELQREMERYLQHVSRPKRTYAVFTRRVWQPPADVFETSEAVVAVIDLSGVKQEEIDLIVTRNSLTVRGERKEIDQRGERVYTCMEIPFGPFERTLEFPTPVDTEHTEASYKGGFLEVVMPRIGATQPRRVQVQPS